MPTSADCIGYSARIIFLAGLLFLAALAGACSNTGHYAATKEDGAGRPEDIIVYKSPFCLCCKEWMTHLQQNNFSVGSDNGLDTAAVKQRWGIPASMQGCHTGVWRNQYVFEGHVPARLIRKFLANPPKDSIGLSVPGMPKGSPGMYRGGEFEPYVVYQIQRDGEYRFYEKVTAPEAS
ncbi:DUF411 domain-containing protein [Microbulbifer harenosus]|uniref:DUF411 domain-containing protein n=2 Tax=Microbulbifer harenosus TaxID=2576840 RepID=A0ABY2UFP3_9GAMM|nr:DUF411 domain-containing protein [Microbulbifer harenosus]TLM76421.1 DUF411 domain-containing protein [Microbulbifer harenosus]